MWLQRSWAQDRIQIVHQTLHHLRRIYSMKLSSVTWVQATVEHFTLLLDRQLGELEVCVKKASPGSRARKNATVLKYFKDLTKFLKQKSGHLSRQCGTERRSLDSKPLDLVKLSTGIHAQDRIQIVHQTLHHLRRIYSMKLSSVTWVQATVEHFTLLLDRQLRELEVCVKKASPGSRARKNATVLKYFKDLTKFLKQKGFSDCALGNNLH
ncbi:interferon tau-like isoform X1 [Leucoraja erinacea]|uniref:interferon tau-like isoform X1 n=1 Tax=Leucoraja erinaceus TaxID=7782 RepID=UPI002457E57C|nr:interferon tau-like isoform X1 [Leucoraja erinacea]